MVDVENFGIVMYDRLKRNELELFFFFFLNVMQRFPNFDSQ